MMRHPAMAAGAAIGFAVYAVHVVSTAFTIAFRPMMLGRARVADFAAMAAYALVFVAAGAAIGRMAPGGPRFVRFVSSGAIVGGVVWSYLTATWRLSWRAFSQGAPQFTYLESWVVGAGLGALAGALLLVVVGIRARLARS